MNNRALLCISLQCGVQCRLRINSIDLLSRDLINIYSNLTCLLDNYYKPWFHLHWALVWKQTPSLPRILFYERNCKITLSQPVANSEDKIDAAQSLTQREHSSHWLKEARYSQDPFWHSITVTPMMFTIIHHLAIIERQRMESLVLWATLRWT